MPGPRDSSHVKHCCQRCTSKERKVILFDLIADDDFSTEFCV